MARRAGAAVPSTKSNGKQRDLWIEMRPLSTFKKARRNPKAHHLPAIGSSLGRFGMVEVPVIDERTDRMVAGHGRVEQLQADKDAGRAPPARVRLRKDGEWLVPVLRGASFKDDREAEAYLLASNQTTIAGGWENAELASLLADPEPYIEGARSVMGGIDLDPFTCAIAQLRVKAGRYFTKEQDGLAQQWGGRIWFQPPYSQPTIALAVTKLIETLDSDPKATVVGLVNAAVDTSWWQSLARRADLVCVHGGRIGFDQPDGKGGVVHTDNNRYSQTSFYVGPTTDRFRSTFERWGVVGKLS